MLRTVPPRIKRYEALGSIADERTKSKVWEYRVYSSSGNKYYTIEYDTDTQAIMTNDNATFYKWYLGYPALCYLLEQWILEYKEKHAILLKWIYRKQLNTDMKYDFDAVIIHIQATIPWDREAFDIYVDTLIVALILLELSFLWKKKQPPKGW